MFPVQKTYRVVAFRPAGDRIVIWEWLSMEDAVRLRAALAAKSATSRFVIEVDGADAAPVAGRVVASGMGTRQGFRAGADAHG